MQSKQTEALKKVLTELCWYEEAGLGRISTCDAIHTAREALAEQPAPVAKPHEQEPIAYLHQCGKKPELKELSFKKNEPLLAAKGYKAIPLTSPSAQPAPVPLTDEQAHQILLDMAKHIETFGPEDITEQQLSAECVRFICQRVAAHGITKGQPILEQALAAPVQPVVNASAWFALVMNAAAELEDASNCLRDEDAKRVANSGAKHYRDAANALYTTPPTAQRQWVGLTDEEIYECEPKTNRYDSVEFARAIEAKLKEKNNGFA